MKAIAIIDLPDSCRDCRFCYDCMSCDVSSQVDISYSQWSRSLECPLIPLSTKVFEEVNRLLIEDRVE